MLLSLKQNKCSQEKRKAWPNTRHLKTNFLNARLTLTRSFEAVEFQLFTLCQISIVLYLGHFTDYLLQEPFYKKADSVW